MLVRELIDVLMGMPQEAVIRIDTVCTVSPEDWMDIEEQRFHIYSDQYIGKEKEEIVCIDAN